HKGTIRDRLKAARAFVKGCLPRAVPEGSLADARGSRQFRRSAYCPGCSGPAWRSVRRPPCPRVVAFAVTCRARLPGPRRNGVTRSRQLRPRAARRASPRRGRVGRDGGGANGRAVKAYRRGTAHPATTARAPPVCRARCRLHYGTSRHGVAHDDEGRRSTGGTARTAGVWVVPGGARTPMPGGPRQTTFTPPPTG